MPLQAGTRLGAYEVLALIGAGGMGEVYRARDTRLGREVAIKVLPADLVSDANRRRRFVQEAQAASALNHPHIITIYEIESADANDFIVMEYVRGKSLDVMISRGGMRLNELLRIAIPIADALATAHARGIVHRDLKPANVVVGDDGAVKVLDFGLARRVPDEAVGDETTTHVANAGLSAPGTIAGTAAYMSPEQATGGTVDTRSDIFSFGAVLYEIATGVRAFRGDSIADTLAAVLRTQPAPPSHVSAAIPRELERLILRCLRKEPNRRYQTMLDVKIELQEIKEESDSEALSPSMAPPVRRSRRGLGAAAVIGGLALAAAALFVLVRTNSRIALPTGNSPTPLAAVPFTTFPGQESSPAFSPDGSQIAFAWSPEGTQDHFDVYVKVIGSESALQLTRRPGDLVYPAWSPAGGLIAYSRRSPDGTGIYAVSPLGGVERKLTTTQYSYFLEGIFSWSPDGKRIAFYDSSDLTHQGVFILDIATLERRWVEHPSKDCALTWVPVFSGDGTSLAVACFLTVGVNDLYVLPAKGGTGRRVARIEGDFTGLTWSARGDSLIYGANGDLWRVLASGGNPERLLTGRDAALPAVARSGDRLAYTVRSAYNVNLWQVQLTSPARATGPPVRLVSSSKTDARPAFSPDGRHLAFESTRSGPTEIWTSDADGSNAGPITSFRGPLTGSPAWSPDSALIAFDSKAEGRSKIYTVASDGGPVRVVTGVDDASWPVWSPDGKWIYFGASGGILRVSAQGGKATTVVESAFVPKISPFEPLRVFYTKNGRICSMEIDGADERCVRALPRFPDEFADAWVVGRGGVYIINPDPERPGIDFLEFATSKISRVADLTGRPAPWQGPPTLTGDGRRLVYPQLDQIASDIMLVEPFR